MNYGYTRRHNEFCWRGCEAVCQGMCRNQLVVGFVVVLPMQEPVGTMDETRSLFFAHRGTETGFLPVNIVWLVLVCTQSLLFFLCCIHSSVPCPLHFPSACCMSDSRWIQLRCINLLRDQIAHLLLFACRAKSQSCARSLTAAARRTRTIPPKRSP